MRSALRSTSANLADTGLSRPLLELVRFLGTLGVASAVGEGSMAVVFVQRYVMDADSEAVTRTPARATEIR